MTNNKKYFPYKEIIELMQVSYNKFDIIPFDLINTMADYLIQINIKEDKEFKLLLGEGYYK
jgi:hypothetical protein